MNTLTVPDNQLGKCHEVFTFLFSRSIASLKIYSIWKFSPHTSFYKNGIIYRCTISYSQQDLDTVEQLIKSSFA